MLDNLRSAFKSTLIYGLGSLSIKLVGFVLLPLYTKYIPVSDYGILALVESLSQIIVTVFSFNLTLALFRWYWDTRYIQKQKTIFFTALVFSVAVAIGLVLVIFPFTSTISNLLFERTDWSHLLKLMALFSAMEIIISIPATLMRLQEKAGLYAITQIIRLMVNLVSAVILLVYINRSVESIYIAQLIGSTVYFLVLLPYFLKNIKIHFETQILKEMLAYAIPTVIGSISILLVSFADRYLLKYFGVLADVGLYSLGVKIANIILFVVMSIQMAIAPLIYKTIDRPESKRFFSKIMTYLAFFIMFLVLGVSFFGRETVKVLARNPDYWSAYHVIPFLAFGIFFYTLKEMANTGLVVARNTKRMALITTLMSGLNVLLDILIIPHLQTIGAAIAIMITQLCYLFIVYRFSQKAYPIQYEVIKLIKVTLLGISLVLLSECANELSSVLRVFVKILLLCFYPLLLYFMRFYEDIELLRLEQAWKKWKHPHQWRKILRLFTAIV
jgi:Membrane protein involved in the export of O-antigen and teichoic acid